MSEELPLVRIIATGGTIAGKGDNPLQTMGYRAGQLTIEEITATIPGLSSVARIEGEQFVNLPSSALDTSDWLNLASRINSVFEEDHSVSGIVITHGTDTLEETAYFLSLVVKSDKPVVIVGSMRPATSLSPDGPMNLLNAVRVASSPAARGLGVLVVMNDEIYAARDVTKTNANRLDTFRSYDLGALGSIDNGEVAFYHRPLRKLGLATEFCVNGLKTLPRVDILLAYVGADDVLVNAVLAAKAKGIVLAGTGAGHISPSAEAALRQAYESGTLVVRASRTGTGRILQSTPENFVAADNLSPQKARILLMLALTKTNSKQEIQRIFQEY